MELATRRFLLASLLVVLSADAILGAQWSYDGEKGVHYWHELFPQACSGRYQSPIDIHLADTIYDPNLRDFAIWYDPPRPGSTMTLLNNGHTVQVTINGEFYVANGGLPYVYKTAQFHFHWGHEKHHGSEHLIDGEAFPLELHIVNYNDDLYDNIGEAVTEKQGLAVLGVMFEVTGDDNEDLEPIIAAMDQVRDPDEGNQVQIEPLSLRNLLPEDISKYYRYNGSLTTPGCFESVVWTVFAKPRTISHRQMRKFREMLQSRPHHGHHKRSVDMDMPLGRRERRRERRALQVLDELALTPEQQARFRRDLEEKKNNADKYMAKMDEENAGESHNRMKDAVTEEVLHAEEAGHSVSEVEVEYIQEKLVNNFRPPQPLNGRTVYRSFRMSELHEAHHHQGTSHDGGHSEALTVSEMEALLKKYASRGAAPSSAVVSLLMLVCSCLLARFL